tara:strand:+ start:1880 stop:2188 length:309 start_codon:yes stop_codon:yes gene_type:complete
LTFTIVNAKCDPTAAQDKTLPTNSYLVEYEDEGGVLLHDLVLTAKVADVFDHYYDKFKKGLKTIKQSEGRANPKTWHPPGAVKEQPAPPKKRRRRDLQQDDE